MTAPRRVMIVAAAVLLVPGLLRAQPAVSVAGHWEGSVHLPAMDVPLEIDLDNNASGELAGTFGQPAQKLRGLPLSNVTLDARTVAFARTSGSTFRGTLEVDGTAITGQLASVTFGTLPVTLTRTGDAHIEASPRNPPISKEMTGVWTGTIDLDSGYHVILRMANQADGTSTGTMVSVDEHGLELPVAVTQKGSTLAVEVPSLGASFSGALNAAGTELAGNYKTAQGAEVPLTLRRENK